ncbi:hypothetical protein E2C01_012718 [Portunus trituberculatus]|uniref:Uncharacterized protein n=1 Tax=Portunus trituberculatus TaxID=210409 RepID=A0A5B7DEU9_PORTR|nr:hypothetical protein [Portunus trituberculatus]
MSVRSGRVVKTVRTLTRPAPEASCAFTTYSCSLIYVCALLFINLHKLSTPNSLSKVYVKASCGHIKGGTDMSALALNTGTGSGRTSLNGSDMRCHSWSIMGSLLSIESSSQSLSPLSSLASSPGGYSKSWSQKAQCHPWLGGESCAHNKPISLL